MKSSVRAYYSAIALLLIYIAGFMCGFAVATPFSHQVWEWDIFLVGLILAGILFHWAATRDAHRPDRYIEHLQDVSKHLDGPDMPFQHPDTFKKG
jgi:hypothetical protein